jgi:hypothetical protein
MILPHIEINYPNLSPEWQCQFPNFVSSPKVSYKPIQSSTIRITGRNYQTNEKSPGEYLIPRAYRIFDFNHCHPPTCSLA